MTFEKWLRIVAKNALGHGVVDIDSIESLCKSIQEKAYEDGYQKGKSVGYDSAVRDMEEESQNDL